MTAYYNDNDNKVCAWLRELIKAGLITDGEVDERDIRDIEPADLKGFDQVHLFAGIGGFSYALRMAGWPDDRPVWTGSCPCQPFSVAGKGKGVKDERHLWPAFRWLIAQCRPPIVFGEQVAGKDGREWLAGVLDDLDIMGYTVGAANLPACSVGAPHIRQRLWWVGYAERERCGKARSSSYRPAPRFAESESTGRLDDSMPARRNRAEGEVQAGRNTFVNSSPTRGVADGDNTGSQGRNGKELPERRGQCSAWESCSSGGMADSSDDNRRCRKCGAEARTWQNRIWWWGSSSRSIECQDGKQRRIPVEPALFPLVDGFPERVGLLRGSGNAIIPQVAAEFIRAVMAL